LAAAEALGEAIYYVDARDTRLEPGHRLTDRLALFTDQRDQRAWRYVILGDGYDEAFLREICTALRSVGQPCPEHRTRTPGIDRIDGMKKSVQLLQRATGTTDHATPPIGSQDKP
jgi:hypothetical protein